jgi:hypothetical protein
VAERVNVSVAASVPREPGDQGQMVERFSS